MRIAERGRLDVLATYSANDGVERGGSLPTDRSRYLVSRLRDGPWVDIVGSPTPREQANVFWSADLELAAGAPLYAGTRPVGLLVIGVAGSDVREPGDAPGADARRGHRLRQHPERRRGAFDREPGSSGRDPRPTPAGRLDTSLLPGLPAHGRPRYPGRARFQALTRFTDGTPPDVRFAEATEFHLGLGTRGRHHRRRAARHPGARDRGLHLGQCLARLVLRTDLLQPLLELTDRKVVLELTEHARIEDYPALRTALATYGPRVTLSVDDAGAGYASLRHILELRPDYVKLDISIVRGIEDDQVRQALVSGLVYFAGHTGSVLVAEGIETEREAAALVDLG